MPTLLYLYLLLATFSISVSSRATLTVYNNCSGDYPLPLPDSVASIPFFKPQIRVNPLEINKNGTGWEEWLVVAHNQLPGGSVIVYGYKWGLGDPASANVSHHAFSVWAHFPNGTLYHQTVHDVFKYEKNPDGGFTYSIANNHLTWDPVHAYWNASINANGLRIEAQTEKVQPDIPFAPSYDSIPGQISKDFFSRLDSPRGHSEGYMKFPWGLNITIQSIGSLKHTWSNKAISDTLSAYVRGSIFLPPRMPPIPITTVSWYQAWDHSGKEIDSMQFMIQPDGIRNGQALRLQITDAPKILSIITTPTPTSLPLTYNGTELTYPMCRPGVDFEHTDEKMRWKVTNIRNIFGFVDLAGGVTVYQLVNITGNVWVNGTLREVGGGDGIVEMYHRG